MDRWIDDRWIDGQTDQQTNRPNNSRTEHTKAMYPLLLDEWSFVMQMPFCCSQTKQFRYTVSSDPKG